MTEKIIDRQVAAMRSFNRFYTEKIGVLPEGHLASEFSLTEVRVLFELAQRENHTASLLAADLGLDEGYLSRILRKFEKQGLIERTPAANDARQNLLLLTKAGQQAFAPLNQRAQQQIGKLLTDISPANRKQLIAAMELIQTALGAKPVAKTPYLLRMHQPGDMGWVVYRHGLLYAQEYGWDMRFEALVAEIVASFIKNFDPQKERCWIAEKDDEIVGSVFLVKKSQTVAKLRLLLVEPSARGLGIGSRLVNECQRFARQAGYHKIVLWTNNVLDAARHIYQSAGYQLIDQQPHADFGENLIGETWELKL